MYESMYVDYTCEQEFLFSVCRVGEKYFLN